MERLTNIETEVFTACYEFFIDKSELVTFDWIMKEMKYSIADCTLRRTLKKLAGLRLIKLTTSKTGQKRNANGYYLTDKGTNQFQEYKSQKKI